MTYPLRVRKSIYLSSQDFMSQVKQERTNKRDISCNMTCEVTSRKAYAAARRHRQTS